MLVVGAVFNRDELGLRYAANRGYNPLPPTTNLSQIRIWNDEVPYLQVNSAIIVPLPQ